VEVELLDGGAGWLWAAVRLGRGLGCGTGASRTEKRRAAALTLPDCGGPPRGLSWGLRAVSADGTASPAAVGTEKTAAALPAVLYSTTAVLSSL